ncbi:MAG: histidinol dehydrogenase [Chloroflexota bacterium]
MVDIQFFERNTLTDAQLKKIMRRSETDISELLPSTQKVIDDVRENGDSAVVKYARQWDSEIFEASMLRAMPEDFARARQNLEPDIIKAIEVAHTNILKFHEEQLPEQMWFTEVQPGIMAGEKVTPIASVACYVPRGKGAFPSVMLMLATPALVAGVPRTIPP